MSSNAQSTSHEEIRQAIAICRAFDRNLRNEFEHLGFGDEPIGSFVDCTAFKPAAFDVTDTIKSVCKSSGINVLDLSDACRPSMTVADYYVLKNRMWRHLLQKPDDAVFVACDNHLTFEFLQFDAESAIPLFGGPLESLQMLGKPMQAPTREHHPTAMIWRGEDYARISSKIDTCAGVVQALQTIGVSGAFECAVCMADLHDGLSIVEESHSPFICGHALCYACSPKVSACPTCREEKRTTTRLSTFKACSYPGAGDATAAGDVAAAGDENDANDDDAGDANDASAGGEASGSSSRRRRRRGRRARR
jgi:hypothetical protein